MATETVSFDLLQNLLFFKTAHGWSDPGRHYSTLQVLLDGVLYAYRNLLDTESNSLAVANIVMTVNALRNTTYSLFLLLHYLPTAPELIKTCLNFCHDQEHTLAFIKALVVDINRELDGPTGWILFGADALPESAPSPIHVSEDQYAFESEVGTSDWHTNSQSPAFRHTRLQTSRACELTDFVDYCRQLWLSTATEKTMRLFHQFEN